jgi:hypothetical protein
VLLEMPLVWLQAGFTRGEEMKTVDEILEMVLDYGDSRQHESSDKWSTKSIRDAIEELVKDAARWQYFRDSDSGVTLRLHNSRKDKRNAAIDEAMKEHHENPI